MKHTNKPESENNKIRQLLEIMHRLRAECPWDARQTHESLRPYLLEEAYEVLESIESKDWDDLAGELGDLLLQIIFHCEIASEKERFDFADVVGLISKKLIERHPHVFGKEDLHSAEQVQENWEHSKIINEKRRSLLSGIPKSAPALLQARRLQEKAATVGFDWPEVKPVMKKIEEEIGELKEAVKKEHQPDIEHELGDLLFSIVNLSRHLKINAEDALRQTNKKFVERFQFIEKHFDGDPKKMKSQSLEALDELWEKSKQVIKK